MQQETIKTGKRTAQHAFNLRLNKDLYDALKNEVEETGITKSQIIRRTLMEKYGFLKKNKHQNKEKE